MIGKMAVRWAVVALVVTSCAGNPSVGAAPSSPTAISTASSSLTATPSVPPTATPIPTTPIPGRPGYRPVPACDGTNAEITYEFTAAVTPAIRDAIKSSNELAQRYVKETFNDAVCGTTVRAWSYRGGDPPPDQLGGIGFSCCQPRVYLQSTPRGRSYWFDVSQPQFFSAEAARTFAMFAYIEMWNDWLGCFFGQPDRDVVRNAPVWYQVGFKTYLQDEVLRIADFGRTPAGFYLAEAKKGRTVLPIRDLVANPRPGSEENDYKSKVGYVAFSLLVARSGLGETIQFCRRVGQGEPWEKAFVGTFRIPVESFYEEYDAYLAR